MQSTDEWKEWRRYFSAKEDASTAMRRDGMRATRKTTMHAWAGCGVFALLLLASLAYAAFGGRLAPKVSPIPGPDTLAAAIMAELDDDMGGAMHAVRMEDASARPGEEKQWMRDIFPASQPLPWRGHCRLPPGLASLGIRRHYLFAGSFFNST